MIGTLLGLLSLLPQGGDEVLRVIGPRPPTVQLGSTAIVDLIVEGERAAPRAPDVPDVPGLEFRLSGPSRSMRQSIMDGRMEVSVEVSYRLIIEPTRVGEFTIPPFRVYTGTKWQETPELRLDVFKDLTGQELGLGFLEVTPSATRVYVHEPLSFIVDLGVDDALEVAQGRSGGTAYLDVHVQAHWLDDLRAGEVLPVDAPRNPVPIVLNRRIQEAEYQPGHGRDGRTYKRFLIEKSFLPNRLGTFELDAPILVVAVEVDRPRMGLFGERVRGRVEQFRIYGEPLTIEVLPIPEEGRPVPYYGAVGRFDVAASVDRDRARVGSSVKLTLSITGSGNFEFLRIPELDDLPGLHRLGKAVNAERDRVDVTYDLTPLDPSVTEIPPIRWNYFDTRPGVETFVEVKTDPIPITVVPLDEAGTLAPLPGAEAESVIPGVDDIYTIKEIADVGPGRVVPPRSSTLVTIAVFGPWLLAGLLGAGLRFRRRRRADVVGNRARGAARRFDKELGSGREPGECLVAYLAARLGIAEAAVIGPDLADRLVGAGVPGDLAAETQRAVERAVAARYGGGGGLDAAAARELVGRFDAQPGLKLLAGAGAILLLGLLHPLAAQDRNVYGMHYLEGDYEKSVELLREAIDAGAADRTLYYNLGNSYYRLGRLPEALWAYENARLAMPRDPELLANIALVERRLDLTTAEGEPFVDALLSLRDSFTSRERLWLCGLCNGLAAAFLLLGWQRRALRTAGFAMLLPALALAIDVLVVEPNQAPAGIVLHDRAALVSEPRAGMEPVLTLRGGVSVEVLAEGPAWTRVRVRGRSGFLPADTVGVVR